MSRDRFGVFYQTGHWDRTIAFRVDDPEVDEGKRIVCGCCVAATETAEGRMTGGSYLCEECDQPFGRSEAHEAAIVKATA